MRKLLTFLIVLGGDCLWSVLARTRGLRHCSRAPSERDELCCFLCAASERRCFYSSSVRNQ
jgi:hypothetical protein